MSTAGCNPDGAAARCMSWAIRARKLRARSPTCERIIESGNGWTVIRLTEEQLKLDFIERIVALLRQSSSSVGTISG